MLLSKVEVYKRTVCGAVIDMTKEVYEYCETFYSIFRNKTVNLRCLPANDDNMRKNVRLTNLEMSHKGQRGVVKRIHLILIVLGMFLFFLGFTGNIVGIVLIIVIAIVGLLILILYSRETSNSNRSPSSI